MLRVLAAAPGVLCALAVAATVAVAHGGGSTDYESKILTVRPPESGLAVRVVDRDDRLQLRAGGRSVVVEGYEGEPYARLLPDGTVQVNRRSPALYLNEDRFADVAMPEIADAQAPPRWRTLDRSGQFEWHDHRIHWMGAERPAKVRDEGVRTKVFDWSVPLRVDGRAGEVAGTLDWVGRPGGGFPLAAAIGLAAVIGAGMLLVVVVRRRRSGGAGRGEAW